MSVSTLVTFQKNNGNLVKNLTTKLVLSVQCCVFTLWYTDEVWCPRAPFFIVGSLLLVFRVDVHIRVAAIH